MVESFCSGLKYKMAAHRMPFFVAAQARGGAIHSAIESDRPHVA
jgi:hypothetical protein